MSATSTHLITAEQFAALQRENLRMELIRGEICAMPPTFGGHGKAAMRLGVILGSYVLAHDLGEVYAAETGFLVARDPDTVRAPDVAFIAKNRVPSGSEDNSWVRVMPDLVAEVVSSGDRATEIIDKAQMWLDAGVRVVWIAYPARQEIEVYRPSETVVTLGVADTLEGYDVVPGFTAPVARMFG